MKQYAWKPHRPKDKDEEQSKPSAKSASRPRKKKKTEETEGPLVEELAKRELVNAMDKEHPIVTLTVGTLKANITRASGSQDEVAKETLSTVKEVVQIAANVKRSAQAVIGRFVQLVSAEPRSDMDIEVLHAICPPMTEPNEEGDDENDEEAENPSSKYSASKTRQETFLQLLLRHLYSGESLGQTKNGRLAKHLLTRCPVPPPKNLKTYQGKALLDSTGRQLAQELRQHYKRGCLELVEKVGTTVDEDQAQLHSTFNLYTCCLTSSLPYCTSSQRKSPRALLTRLGL